MQLIKQQTSIWYFVFGCSQKTSLSSQFCREHNYLHFVNPQPKQLDPSSSQHAIIQGTVDLFSKLQKIKPELSVILVGDWPTNEAESEICFNYQALGRLKYSAGPEYELFRKALYPNLIFIYGPIQSQNCQIASILASNTGYSKQKLLQNVNEYISVLDKTKNLVISNLFQNVKDVRILEQYFNIKIIHLKYNRIDIQNRNQYFDRQFALVNFLKNKPYYVQVAAKDDNLIEVIGQKLCPKLIYVNVESEDQVNRVKRYISQSSGFYVNFQKVEEIYNKKGLPPLNNNQAKLHYLSSIFYAQLNTTEILVSAYPKTLNQILAVEKINRKFSTYLDLTPREKYKPSQNYPPQVYFLQQQKYLNPDPQVSLLYVLSPKINYWIVAGPSGVGKSTAAKFISTQFGYKLIQFETQLPKVIEKLQQLQQKQNPDAGEDVPVPKIQQYFKTLFENDKQSTYVLDGFPYQKTELKSWIANVGVPNVLYLNVEIKEQINRSRKKAGSQPLGLDIGEKDLQEKQELKDEYNATNQSRAKANAWIETLQESDPSATIFRLDNNGPEIVVQNDISRIFKPRIFFVQKNNTNIYQNIAIKYGLGFINLNKYRLRDIASIVKDSNKRDIIICNHGHEKKRIASEDLYWVERNLGEIRYLAIWESEAKEIQQVKLELQRPQPPKKSKVEGEGAEGIQGQEKQQEEPQAQAEGDQEGEKKKFDIYAYEWTKAGNYKNLSQWFFKLKKNIQEFNHSAAQVQNSFKHILEQLNNSPNTHVYQKIK